MSQQVATQTTDVVLRLVGESGEGTVSLGDLTVQMFAAMGLDIYTFQTFPAEIKGGTVMYQIRAKSGTVLSHGDYADVVVALNDEGFGLFGEVLREDGILLRLRRLPAGTRARSNRLRTPDLHPRQSGKRGRPS